MIKLRAEATIKLDENRSIWFSADAEGDPTDVNLPELAAGMQAAVAAEALAAYDRLVPQPRQGRVPADAGAATEKALEQAALRGESPEVSPLSTFGSDD